MRRLVGPLSLLAALIATGTASAGRTDLKVLTRGDVPDVVPRVRAGTVTIPRGQARGRVSVIVKLRHPPLAAFGRRLQSRGASRRLNTGSRSSRAYLRRLESAQRAAVAALERTIPEAAVSRRYAVVLNGLAVTLPASRLPALARLPGAVRVYPSATYALALNRSPGIIAAEALSAATGAHGDGVKIGIVDDGVDPTNPFFRAAGFAYPRGFPKGGLRWTTPKVIVARVFPGAGAGRAGRLAVDRRTSFHGTHVAGIAAGNAGTTAPRGPDHPRVEGLSGVAPRAWIGNYRVFTVPSPIGNLANTPEIVAAFEKAVRDGMDVINFSGGGPTADPANDPMYEVVANVAAAGVVPVMSAGNDRDDFGLGSAGSPGVAPEGISVAAVSNTHVFGTTLSVTAPGAPAFVKDLPFPPSPGGIPRAWEREDKTLVDVGTIVGRNRQPVDRRLCGSARDPNNPRINQLPAGSLRGAIALASRGTCTFVSKGERAKAAGAIGLVLVNNRPGEAAPISVPLDIPSGMLADADGARLRAVMEASAGRTQIRAGREIERIETGRSGIVMSFSSAGPTDFGHQLKPDVAAPGGSILSSTLREFAGSNFSVFDGTSMAAPHVAGAAALLVQRHPEWTPRQVKSALVATAGSAWGNTLRTQEAPVLLQGGGLVNVPAADAPLVFTDPVSLSFGDLDVRRGAQRRPRFVSIADSGGGAGLWSVEVRPQSASPGAFVDVPGVISLAPGGVVELPVVARAGADADAEASDGLNYGFIALTRGGITRRIPYLFIVTRPGLPLHTASPRRLRRFQTGNTRLGASRADRYRFPAAPFGPAPSFTGPPMDEAGGEDLYVTTVNRAVANLGVAVVAADPVTALIHPWFLGSLDENDVQGYAGTPVNVNGLTPDYLGDIGAAGAVFPRQGKYYVSVDSGREGFTGQARPGRYLLRSWINDVRAPTVRFLTTRVAAGRPLLAGRITDGGAGVNPYSLVIAYGRVLVGASAYDPGSGLVLFALPDEAPALRVGRTNAVVVASDYQESKNVAVAPGNVLPNTRFRAVRIRATRGPAVTWLAPDAATCAARAERLVVVASGTRPLTGVQFFADRRRVAFERRGASGVYATTWSTRGKKIGRHVLKAVARDRLGRTASALRIVRVCR